MPRTINRELLSGFTSEVKSYLPQIYQSLQTLANDPARIEVLEDAHRLAHSVKGAASMLGLSALSHMAFLAEEAIEEIASRQLEWNPDTAAVLERVLVLMEVYLDQLHSGVLKERPILGEAVTRLRRLRGQAESGDQGEIDLLLGTDGDPVVADAAAEPLAVVSAAPKRPGSQQQVSAAQVLQEYQNVPQELLDTFHEEAEEIMHAVGELLLRLEAGGTDKQAMLDVRRHVHTLKGAAGSVGLRALSSLAHRMEDLLDEINQGDVAYTPDVHRLLLTTFDCLGDMTEAQNLQEVGPRTQALYARYASLLDSRPAAPPDGGAPAESSRAVDRAQVPFELMEAFRAETEEHVLRIGEGLRAIERNPENKELVLEIRRTIHTLKGAANMVGMRSMSALAHEAEDVLDGIYGGAIPLSPENLSLLFSVTDTLSDMAAGGSQPEGPDERLEQLSRLSAEARPARASAPLEPLESEKAIDIPQAPERPGSAAATRRSSQFVRVPLDRLDELVRLVSELLVSRSTFEQYLAAYTREVDEFSRSIERLKRISTRIDADFETSALRGGFGQLSIRGVVAQNPLDEKRKDFDVLEFDRYTDFHLVSRDLTETTSDISSAGAELAHRITDFDSYLNRLGRLTSEVQDKLMRTRMVPLLTLTTRLHRTIRVTSERQHKGVDLTIEGEHVELDKTVLEDIAAPLEHLLRNAVDHGIESGETRRALGKAPRGQIRLRAFYEGTQVVIQVTDDGGGMEPELLREAAVRSGFYSEAQAAQLSPAELFNLIFLPGFSTARAVSETSGRGVGMDIVRSTVNRMRGTTTVDSEPGRGTAFTIRLPMTLAIMRVLLVESNGETMAVPLSAVSQILRVEPQQMERVGQQMVIRVEGKVTPALRLGDVFHLPRPLDPTVRRLPVLMVNVGERRLALIVERLVEAREVVVKTMGTLLRRVEGVMGATLMGDGSVVLILNPMELLPDEQEQSHLPEAKALATPASIARRIFDVLIVDDSVSVRRVLTNLIRGAGWTAHVAKDGMEALEVLDRAQRVPDVVLLDIEMPRMDGYELLTALRAHESYRNLPVVMLTSRAGEKHRRRAFDLGATDYLVKPYQDETLLTVVRRVVHEARETPVS